MNSASLIVPSTLLSWLQPPIHWNASILVTVIPSTPKNTSHKACHLWTVYLQWLELPCSILEVSPRLIQTGTIVQSWSPNGLPMLYHCTPQIIPPRPITDKKESLSAPLNRPMSLQNETTEPHPLSELWLSITLTRTWNERHSTQDPSYHFIVF